MKRLLATFLAVCMIFSLVGCGTGSTESESAVSQTESSAVASSKAESSALESSEAESPVSSDAVSSSEAEETNSTAVRVAALKGPTAMGMVELMENEEQYAFTLAASADEVTPLVIQGEVDIAAVPANLAAVLYSKTEGQVSVIDINTLGVLYILENGEQTVNSVEDLKGKTIYASGKGATPEYALNYMLQQNGIDPETDVTIEYKSEHTECVAALTTTENAVAMLPQPFATVAQQQNEDIKIVLDMTEEWEGLAAQDDEPVTLVTGVTIVRTEFLQSNPEAVMQFLEDHAASTASVNASPADAAPLMEKYDIVTAAVAEIAIPYCNITCITGEDMKTQLASYLAVLMEQNPESIGGSLPDDAFYYTD